MLLYIVVALVKLFVFHSCIIDVFLRYVRIKKFIIIIVINHNSCTLVSGLFVMSRTWYYKYLLAVEDLVKL